MHPSTFDYVQPTDYQIRVMALVRQASKNYAQILERELPDGPDKTYALRKLREVAMWANVCVTRQPDGSPRAVADVADYPGDHPVEGDLGSVPL
jgi:hypothetical protein